MDPIIHARKLYGQKFETFNFYDFYFETITYLCNKIVIIFNYENIIIKKEIYDLLLNCNIYTYWYDHGDVNYPFCVHMLTKLCLLKNCGKKINIKLKKNKIIIPFTLCRRDELFDYLSDYSLEYKKNFKYIYFDLSIKDVSKTCNYIYIKYIKNKIEPRTNNSFEKKNNFYKSIYPIFISGVKFNGNKCEILLRENLIKPIYIIYSSAKIISCELNNIKLGKYMIKKIKINIEHVKLYIVSTTIKYKKIKKKLK